MANVFTLDVYDNDSALELRVLSRTQSCHRSVNEQYKRSFMITYLEDRGGRGGQDRGGGLSYKNDGNVRRTF